MASATVCSLFRVPSFVWAFLIWLRTVSSPRPSASAVSFRDLPVEAWRSTDCSLAVSGARAVYANETSQTLTTCYALVGETFFGHATAAVFTGLARPGIPTQVFRSIEDALPWVAEMNAARGGAL